MHTWDSITAFLRYGVETVLDENDSNNRRHRERLLLRHQQVVEDFWWSWEWAFRYASNASLSLSASASSMAGPTDLHIGGHEVMLQIPAENQELTYLNPQDLVRERMLAGVGSTGRPRFWTIQGLNASGVPLLEFDIASDAAYTLTMNYEKRPPYIVDTPPAPTVAAGSATGITGTYPYKVTWVTADGETDGGPASASITVTNTKINVTVQGAPAFTRVTSRKLYRPINGGSTYKLVTTITTDPTADVTYVDSTADGSLGADLPSGTSITSGLDKIPDEYHRSVILEGVAALDARDKGDMRSATEFEARWRKNLARAQVSSIPGRERLTVIGERGIAEWRMH